MPPHGLALRSRHALALGLLQGPAELLPVSSSAHTILVPVLARWPYGELPATLRKSFEVALHGGTAPALARAMRGALSCAVGAVDAGLARLAGWTTAASLCPPPPGPGRSRHTPPRARCGRVGRDRPKRFELVSDAPPIGAEARTIGPMSLVGTLLGGRYRLDAEIGRGGMSTVYRAFDTVLERPVAIKLMHREIASHSDQLERFRREARAVAQLNHPHIVTVIDAGEDESTPSIVFEYVEGETLKERIRRFGRLPIPEAIAYAIEIARALGAAHERGIVHRDIKPQNVLIDAEGSAKVTDFGIARTLADEGLTADGRVLGTTDYVSPEQALGHVVTGQSDIYSLGIALFEMLTGDVPFRGESQVAVAMRHVREELPDVQRLRPEVSASLAAVVDRATAKDLQRRYLDASSLVADLEDVLAIETARAGHATGEATTVLRTLPGDKRRRVPLRARVAPALAAALLVLVAI